MSKIEVPVYLHNVMNGIIVVSVKDGDLFKKQIPESLVASITPHRIVPRMVYLGLESRVAEMFDLIAPTLPVSGDRSAAGLSTDLQGITADTSSRIQPKPADGPDQFDLKEFERRMAIQLAREDAPERPATKMADITAKSRDILDSARLVRMEPDEDDDEFDASVTDLTRMSNTQ